MKTRILLLMLGAFSQVSAQFVSTNGPRSKATLNYVWASNDTAFAASRENLWRTTNGGQSWDILLNGLPFEVDPRAITVADGMVIIGTNNKARVYSSSDWGDSWSSLIDGASAIWIPTHATSNGKVAIMGGTTFAPHYFDKAQNKWVSTSLSGITHGLTYVNDTTLIANVGSVSKGTTYVSYDDGKNWTAFNAEPSVTTLNLTAKTYHYTMLGKRIVCVPSMNGYNPQYSDDMGDTWTEGTSAKMSTPFAYGRKLVAMPDGKIYLNKNGRLYESSDTGKTWQDANNVLGVDFTRWKTSSLLSSWADITPGSPGTRHELTTTSTNLVELNGKLFTHAESHAYTYSSSWSSDSIINEVSIFTPGTVNKVVVMDDSVYMCSNNGLFASIDGHRFTSKIGGNAGFGIVSAFAKSGGNYVVGNTSTRGNRPPKIFYSSDKSTWTEATFSNTVGFGAGGVANAIENFFEHNGDLYADLQGGFAISKDNGKTWEWKGGSNFGNVVSDGTHLYRLSNNFFGQNSLQQSTDHGESWTDRMDGLPEYTGQSNFNLFGNVFEVDGKIYAEASGDGKRQLVTYNSTSNEWEVVPKTTGLPGFVSLFDLISVNGELYAALSELGVYKVGDEVSVYNHSPVDLTIYPNPATDVITLKSTTDFESIEVMDQLGQVVQVEGLSANRINISELTPGLYYLKLNSNGKSYSKKFIKL